MEHRPLISVEGLARRFGDASQPAVFEDNHLVEFLVNRSRAFDQEIAGQNYDPRRVKLVKPGLAAVNPPAEVVPLRHSS